MTGPLGENEVEIGELGDHDFNKSVADFRQAAQHILLSVPGHYDVALGPFSSD